jgi:nucleotide-binding universal stress UspA family protein
MPNDLAPADLLIPLDVPPSDARMADDALEHADAVVYRLGLRSMPVSNLPQRLYIGGVRVDVVDGPVLAQRTAMRQRAGVLRATFDKHMVREPVGEGEQIAILSIHENPLPDDLDAAFLICGSAPRLPPARSARCWMKGSSEHDYSRTPFSARET